MEEKEILKRIIKSDALFNMIHIVTQRYDILPDNKEHIGAYIEYQDINEMRDGFVEERANTIVDWIYSSEKYQELIDKARKLSFSFHWREYELRFVCVLHLRCEN